MKTIDSSELTDNFKSLLKSLGSGEKYLIIHNGKVVARLTSPQSDPVTFPDRSELRASLPKSDQNSDRALRIQRNSERY